MKSYKSFYLPITLISILSLFTTIIIVTLLYHAAYEEEKNRLLEIVEYEAGLISSVAKFEKESEEVILKQIEESFSAKFKTDLVIAKKSGNNIKILLNQHKSEEKGKSIPFNINKLKSMKLALMGKHGVIEDIGCTGTKILVAHTPISYLNWGLIGLIPISEIRQSFIKAAVSAIILTIVIICVVVLIFVRFTKPIMDRAKDRQLFLDNLFDKGSDGVIVCDCKGNILQSSDAVKDILGYEKNELIGKNVKILTPPEIAKEHDKYIERYLQTGEKKIIGCRVRFLHAIHKDGYKVPINLSVNEIRKSNREIVFSGFIHDMTERENVEKEMLRAKQISDNANNMKSNFLAHMSHEIRTPLNAILGFTELLEEKEIDNESNDLIKRISKAGKTLLLLINDILDFSKIEAGAITLENTHFDLYREAENVISIMSVRAHEKNSQLKLTLSNNVPQYFKGDPLRLSQIILNIVGNAIKFTLDGLVDLYIDYDKENSILNIKITDTGIGISKDRLESIFSDYEQAKKSTSREYGGTGLGLSIVKKLVELMNGNINVKSEEGKGTTFTVCIPLTSVQDSELKIDSKKIADNITENEVFNKELNILVVDDNENNLLVVEKFFSKFPFKISKAENGKEGFESFKNLENIDVVFMDIQMPVMTGPEAVKKIRNWENDNNLGPTPIIAFTAEVRKEKIDEIFKIGFNDFLSKPVKKKKLYACLVENLT